MLPVDSLGGALLPQDSLLLQLTGGDSLLRDTRPGGEQLDFRNFVQA